MKLWREMRLFFLCRKEERIAEQVAVRKGLLQSCLSRHGRQVAQNWLYEAQAELAEVQAKIRKISQRPKLA